MHSFINEASGLFLLFTSAVTHHDAESFEYVEFTHWTGAVFVQPRVHTNFMEDMSAQTQRHVSSKEILITKPSLLHLKT